MIDYGKYYKCIYLNMSAVTLDDAARARLRELKEQYRESKKRGDQERITQLIHMAKSIKKGERFYIYDFPRKSK